VKHELDSVLGYPIGRGIDYSPALHALLPLPFTNNIGDPWNANPFGLNDYERDVVQEFASWFGLDTQAAWGYVTSGSTEANLFAGHVARSLMQAAPGDQTPVLYAAESAHCLGRVLPMPRCCCGGSCAR
jgi:glutamate/tyrosine decarboxylase-like PLP-dependent enzyme